MSQYASMSDMIAKPVTETFVGIESIMLNYVDEIFRPSSMKNCLLKTKTRFVYILSI